MGHELRGGGDKAISNPSSAVSYSPTLKAVERRGEGGEEEDAWPCFFGRWWWRRRRLACAVVDSRRIQYIPKQKVPFSSCLFSEKGGKSKPKEPFLPSNFQVGAEQFSEVAAGIKIWKREREGENPECMVSVQFSSSLSYQSFRRRVSSSSSLLPAIKRH